MKLSPPVPIIRILDETKAREFYVDFLGFTIDWEHRFEDNAPLYLQIRRGACVIHLSEHYGDCTPGAAIRIETDNVDGLNSELLQRHYKYAKPGVGDTPWHTREMSIKDPFGNRLVFYQARQPALRADLASAASMTPVGLTSRWVAASRALETESADPLYRDPYARALAGDAGFTMMRAMRAALGVADNSAADLYLTLRTRFLDDALLASVREASRSQVLILAAGMDARAFRLAWPPGIRLFEVDRDDVFDHKEAVLEAAGARPACDRTIVRADLSQPWTQALVDAGFDPQRPASILAEGLLMYLDDAEVASLFERLRTVTCEGSWLGFDAVNVDMVTSSYTAGYIKKLAEAGCPWKFGVDQPEQFAARYGWHADVVMPGDPEANFGRWRYPIIPRSVPGMPRTYFVRARRLAQNESSSSRATMSP